MKKRENPCTGNKPGRSSLDYLLIQALKSRKLASLLMQPGIEDCPWVPSYNEAVAELVGLRTDEAFRKYDLTMDKIVKKVRKPGDLQQALEKFVQSKKASGQYKAGQNVLSKILREP